MKKRNIAKIVIAVVLIVLAVVIAKLFLKTSFGADNEERAILEGAFNKYVNYELKDGSRGTLVQYSLRTGIKYENDFFAIKGSELNITLNQIDGKYPYDVKVIAKSTKATNGKTSDITEDYNYDSNTGSLIIRTSNQNEDGNPIYNERPEENDRDEFVIISYYDTYTQDKKERDLSCDVTYKAVLFTDDNREITAHGGLEQKVTEDIGELTSVYTNISDIYNGYIKSNIINGTLYNTEYTESNEIVISKKEAHQKINILEENTFINLNDIYYKSTKILKDDIINILGENGKIEILDANNNIIATIDNNTEFNERGEFIVTYAEDVNNISIKTSNIVNEGILHIENVKYIKSNVLNLDDKDIIRKISIIGLNEREVEKTEEVQTEEIENEEITKSIALNLNTANSEITEEQKPAIQKEIIEEECYRTEKEDVLEVKDSTTKVDINISNTEWTNETQNEVTFDIYLNSSSKAYNLFKNPTVRINMPQEVEKVILSDSQISYANGLSLNNVEVVTNEDGTSSIIASLVGNQTQYSENDLGLITDLKIPAKIILRNNIENAISKVNVEYKNEYTLEEGSLEKTINIKSYVKEETQNQDVETVHDIQENLENQIEQIVNEANNENAVSATAEEIEGLKVNVHVFRGDSELKSGDTVHEGEFLKYNVQIENTTTNDISNVKIVGTIPEGLKSGELVSKFDSLKEEERNYNYEFDENLTKKEIDFGTVKAGKTITKYYEVQVGDLGEEETQRKVETNIKAYINNTEAFDYNFENIVEKAQAKVFLWSMVNGTHGEWNYGVNLDNPTGEEVTIKVELPEFFEVTDELINEGRAYVKGFDVEYSTGINLLELINGETKYLDEFDYTLNGREATITTTKSGTYMIGVQAGDESKLQEENPDGLSELVAYATVTTNGNTYESNENRINYGTDSASIEISSENAGEEVNYGEEINYNIAVTCTGVSGVLEETSGIYVNILDYLPEDVKPISVTYEYFEQLTQSGEDGTLDTQIGFSEKKTKTETLGYTSEDEDGNILPNLDIYTWIPYKETINIQIKTTAGYVYEETDIENNAIVQSSQLNSGSDDTTKGNIITKTSNTVKHTIVPYVEEEEPDNPDNPEPDNPDNPEDPDGPDVPVDPDTKYSISGVAWNDANGDGERQDSEELLSGISVMLVDMVDSNNVKDVVSTTNGNYSFDDLEQGNYIVVFNYDTDRYALTKYKASGVSNDVNSDAMEQEITLDGKRVDVGLTDEIILNRNVSNIDIGLMERGGYDFKLDKYITDISVTTVAGTKQYSYDNTKLGRIEIRAKEIEGAEVSIKYKIIVTNEGKAAAKVNEIYDYIPDGLEFSATENSNWTNNNGVLINKSLSNQNIGPGESKEITLILTKTMNGENTGTFTNAAEIGSSSSSFEGMKDSDSTPGNHNEGEDDYSEAELIIGVSTGLVVYISIGMILLTVVILTLLGIKFKFKIKKLSKFGLSIMLFLVIGMISCRDVFGLQLVYTGNGVSTHGFVVYGGPTSTAQCTQHNTPAAGQNTAVGYECNDSESSYSYTFAGGRGKVYTGVQEILSDAIDLKKLNEKIEARKVGQNYVLGPFESSTNSSDQPYTITVYSKQGGTLGYTLCDASGNPIGSVNGAGNVTFYISLTAGEYAKGISKVTARQGKIETIRKYWKLWREVHYIYTGPQPCTGPGSEVRGHYHQDPWGPEVKVDEGHDDISTWTYGEIEWTDINIVIELLKVDMDEHQNGDDYEIYLDIEGTLTKTDGSYNVSFKTTDGKYTFDNLEPGTYILKETINNNYGYEDNMEMELTVNGSSGTLFITYMENTKYTGNLKIIKRDKDTGDPMSDIGFKLYKEDEGYVIGINASGSPIRQARGSVQFHNMEYTQDPSQATEFITGDDGEMNIYNIRIGTYRVEEVSVNIPIYGYDLDEEYVYWSSGLGSGEHELIGRVEVVRRKSYYTTAKGGGAYPTSTPDSEFDTITFENRRKWVKLSGKVWEDMIDSKDSTRNYALDEGGADKLVANVTVRLKDRSGSIVPFKTSENTEATVTQIDTDSNGAYTMVDVLIDEIPNYYIEFSYNGMSFVSVPVLDSPSLDSDNYNGTRAIESEAERTEFNRKYSEITHSGSTGPIGESRDDGGSKTYNLNYHENEKYELEDGTTIDQIKSTLNYGEGSNSYGYEDAKFPVNHIDEQYMITASTKEAFTQEGYSGYLSDMKTPEEIRTQDNGAGQYHGVEEITNMNLGIREREQPDLALIEDIEQVQIDLNGYTHTYNYNQRFENQEEYGDGFDIGVKFGNEYGKQEYTQAIYPSDVVYNQGHENTLGIYVRYKIALRNESTTLYSRVNEVINHYDANYEIPQDDIVVTAVVDDAGVGLQYTEEGGSGAFKKVTIQANQELKPQETKYIYITYRLTNDAVNQLLDGIAPIESVAEIGSYSTYENGFSIHYAGVDKDSRPGSAEPGNEETYEDDTDSAPSFLLEVQELRELKGTVWEDEAVQELLNISQEEIDAGKRKERIGNGEYEDSENIVQDVKVELLVLSYEEDSEIDLANASLLSEGNVQDIPQATLYTDNWQTEGTPAETMTGADGSYTFSGVIPGKYLLRFTYGDESVIVYADGSGSEKIKDVDKYKSTIYRGNRPENESTANGDTDYWYRNANEMGESASRWSDARDEVGIKGLDGSETKFDLLAERLGGEKEYYYGNTDPSFDSVKADATKAIEARTRGFEIRMDYNTETGDVSEFLDKEEGKIISTFDNIDFGIIRRPIQRLNVKKEIAYVKVTLANGQVLVEGDPRTEEIKHLKFLPDGNVHIEIDSEIIQGATLTIKYEIIADNTQSELDYDDSGYYIFGTPDNPSTEIAPQPKRILDYLSNELIFNKEDNPDWSQCEIDELKEWFEGEKQYFSEDAYNAIKKFNQVLQTDAFADMKIEKRSTFLEVSRVLSNNADDFIFDNDMEVNILTGRRTTKDGTEDEYTIPGNYIPSNGETGGDDDYVYLTVTGPTGENQNYIPYIVLGISAFIILGTGIVFIKKKVV